MTEHEATRRVVIPVRSSLQLRPFFAVLLSIFAFGPWIGLGLRAGLRELGLEVRGAAWLLAFWSVGAIVSYVFWLVLRRSLARPRELVIDASGLQLPRGLLARAPRVIAWTDLSELWIAPESSPQILMIEAQGLSFALHATQVGGPNDLTLAYDAIVAWLRAMNRDQPILDQLRKHREYDLSASSRVRAATYAIVTALVAVYLLELSTGAAGKPLSLLMLGANAGSLVRVGQIERLFTANLLHGGLAHLYFNGISILFLAGLLERGLGRSRMLIIYLASGIAGALASAVTSDTISVGASTSVFGLLGAHAVVARVHKDHLPVATRGTRRWWIVTITLNAALPILLPVIDWRAHVGGFVAGVLIAAVIARSPDVIAQPGRASLGLHAAAAALLAAYAGAVGVVAYYAIAVGGDARARIVSGLAGAEIQPVIANNIGWEIAIEPEASPAAIEGAADLVQRALPATESSGRAEMLDTLAHLQHRAGLVEEAVQNEARAFKIEPKIAAAALARFLLERENVVGPQDIRAVAGSTISTALEVVPGGTELVLEIEGKEGRPLAIYAVALIRSRPRSLLAVCIAPDAQQSLRFSVEAPGKGVELGPPYAIAGGCSPEPGSSARFHPLAGDAFSRP